MLTIMENYSKFTISRTYGECLVCNVAYADIAMSKDWQRLFCKRKIVDGAFSVQLKIIAMNLNAKCCKF